MLGERYRPARCSTDQYIDGVRKPRSGERQPVSNMGARVIDRGSGLPPGLLFFARKRQLFVDRLPRRWLPRPSGTDVRFRLPAPAYL